MFDRTKPLSYRAMQKLGRLAAEHARDLQQSGAQSAKPRRTAFEMDALYQKTYGTTRAECLEYYNRTPSDYLDALASAGAIQQTMLNAPDAVTAIQQAYGLPREDALAVCARFENERFPPRFSRQLGIAATVLAVLGGASVYVQAREDVRPAMGTVHDGSALLANADLSAIFK